VKAAFSALFNCKKFGPTRGGGGDGEQHQLKLNIKQLSRGSVLGSRLKQTKTYSHREQTPRLHIAALIMQNEFIKHSRLCIIMCRRARCDHRK